MKKWSQASNIVFVNGNIDPWHALSVWKQAPSIKNNVTTVFIDKGAHCSNMSPYRPGKDPISIKQAQDQIRAIIGQFIEAASR